MAGGTVEAKGCFIFNLQQSPGSPPEQTAVDSDWLLSGWLSIVETVGRTLRLIGASGMSEVSGLSMCGRRAGTSRNLSFSN